MKVSSKNNGQKERFLKAGMKYVNSSVNPGID
jgi:hypothetical protein